MTAPGSPASEIQITFRVDGPDVTWTVLGGDVATHQELRDALVESERAYAEGIVCFAVHRLRERHPGWGFAMDLIERTETKLTVKR